MKTTRKAGLILTSVAVIAAVSVWYMWVRNADPLLIETKNTSSDVLDSFAEETQKKNIEPSKPAQNVDQKKMDKKPSDQIIEYRFFGKVIESTNESGSVVLLVSQNAYQPQSEGLYQGYKGHVRIDRESCNVKANTNYSFKVTYNVQKDKYQCITASTIIYD